MSESSVLEARELRWQNKKRIAAKLTQQFPGIEIAVAYITLRMPAKFRMSGRFDNLVTLFQNVLADNLKAGGISVLASEIETYPDGPSGWIAAACAPVSLKRLAVNIEEKHALGTLIDIDIVDCSGVFFSRRDMGFGARKCFICNEEAAVCSAGQHHSHDEIAQYIEQLISLNQFIMSSRSDNFGSCKKERR